MEISLIPVTQENRQIAESLSVFPSQENFIESVKECMQEADQISDWHPILICSDDNIIGFTMYGYMNSEKTPRLWFDRLLIDSKYQNCGYGKKAVKTIINQLHKEYPGKDIYLSAYIENQVAINLYKSFGFIFNGELDLKGEKIMILKS